MLENELGINLFSTNIEKDEHFTQEGKENVKVEELPKIFGKSWSLKKRNNKKSIVTNQETLSEVETSLGYRVLHGMG